MKTKNLLLMLTCLFLMSNTNIKRQIHIYMIGDSTMANKLTKVYPETGWGQVLPEFFKKGVVIDNRAKNGRSTKSFIAENRWAPVKDSLQAGDFVIIQFGHNDEKINLKGVGTSIAEYKANLIKFIKETRAKNAVPILCTPIVRRRFQNGKFLDSHGLYPQAVKDVAKRYNVVLIDMESLTRKVVVKMGEEQSKKLYNWVPAGRYKYYPKGAKDNTHLNPYGARKYAKIAAVQLKRKVQGLKHAVK